MEPKGSLCIHKYLPPAPILSELHPVHTPTSHFLKIRLNINLPSMSGSPHWSLSLKFPHPNRVHTSPLPHTRHILSCIHFFNFKVIKNIALKVYVSCALPVLCVKFVLQRVRSKEYTIRDFRRTLTPWNIHGLELIDAVYEETETVTLLKTLKSEEAQW